MSEELNLLNKDTYKNLSLKELHEVRNITQQLRDERQSHYSEFAQNVLKGIKAGLTKSEIETVVSTVFARELSFSPVNQTPGAQLHRSYVVDGIRILKLDLLQQEIKYMSDYSGDVTCGDLRSMIQFPCKINGVVVLKRLSNTTNRHGKIRSNYEVRCINCGHVYSIYDYSLIYSRNSNKLSNCCRKCKGK